MPRFLVSLSRGLLEILRMGEPRAVTLADGTRGEARDLTPIGPSSHPATNDTLASGGANRDIPD